MIGAVIRAERGVRLNAPLAGRVNAAISSEPALGLPLVPQAPQRGGLRWWQPVAGGALAAGVATLSVLWLRAQAPLGVTPLSAQRLPAAATGAPGLAAARVVDAGVNSYVTPAPPPVRPMLVPSTQLANYVVAHSMFSSPGRAAQPASPRSSQASRPPPRLKTRQGRCQEQCALASDSWRWPSAAWPPAARSRMSRRAGSSA